MTDLLPGADQDHVRSVRAAVKNFEEIVGSAANNPDYRPLRGSGRGRPSAQPFPPRAERSADHSPAVVPPLRGGGGVKSNDGSASNVEEEERTRSLAERMEALRQSAARDRAEPARSPVVPGRPIGQVREALKKSLEDLDVDFQPPDASIRTLGDIRVAVKPPRAIPERRRGSEPLGLKGELVVVSGELVVVSAGDGGKETVVAVAPRFVPKPTPRKSLKKSMAATGGSGGGGGNLERSQSCDHLASDEPVVTPRACHSFKHLDELKRADNQKQCFVDSAENVTGYESDVRGAYEKSDQRDALGVCDYLASPRRRGAPRTFDTDSENRRAPDSSHHRLSQPELSGTPDRNDATLVGDESPLDDGSAGKTRKSRRRLNDSFYMSRASTSGDGNDDGKIPLPDSGVSASGEINFPLEVANESQSDVEAETDDIADEIPSEPEVTLKEREFDRFVARWAGKLPDDDAEIRRVFVRSGDYKTALDYARSLCRVSVKGDEEEESGGEYGGADVGDIDAIKARSMVTMLSVMQKELLLKAEAKLAALATEKASLCLSLEELKQLEAELSAVVEERADAKLCAKYRACVEDLDRVTQLLLLLAGRLARTHNTLAALPSDPAGQLQKAQLMPKRDELVRKRDDAAALAQSIASRCHQVSLGLRACLPCTEYARYRRMLAEKRLLQVARQSIEDRTSLAEEQASALRRHLADNSSSC